MKKFVLCSLLALITACDSAPKTGPAAGSDEKRDPQLARKLNDEAAEKIEKGKLDEALPLLERAVAADPSFAPAHNNLGLIHFEQGRLYQAALEFGSVVQLAPESASARNNLGLVFESAGKTDDAVKRFEQASRMEPNNPEFLGNLVRAKIRRGDVTSETKPLLEKLVFIETRPDWRTWAESQLSRLPKDTKTLGATP